MRIREARLEDAQAACDVLRRSITDLCRPDHCNNKEILSRWLANKTADSVAAWISDAGIYTFVAEESGQIVGFSAITRDGHITLNYVSPDARFKGVSKSLLARLEAKARELGHKRCTLESTMTARRFYVSAGYVEEERLNSSGLPMSKRLIDG
jgi:GNAT superfamily N-acetyltransferase